jgi:SAM-dependent methyltransferase
VSEKQLYTIVDGIKCYSLKEANRYVDYPDDGFDLTDKLEETSFWVRSRSRLLKKIIDKYSSQSKKTRFLEIGCGTGTFIREILTNGKLTITGSEIYLKGLLSAKKKLPDVEFIQFDARYDRLPESFDIIGAFDVLEHIDNDTTALSNIHKMLNEKGYFILTVPQYMFLWSRLDEIIKHKRRYSRRELLSKLEKQGFTICFCSSFLFVLFPLMLISRLRDRGQNTVESEKMEFESKVSFPKALNWIFDKFMRIDEFLIEKGVSLPFGGSLLAIAKKATPENVAYSNGSKTI